MVLLKIARTKSGTVNIDDYVDGCGYLSIAGELTGAQVDSWVREPNFMLYIENNAWQNYKSMKQCAYSRMGVE